MRFFSSFRPAGRLPRVLGGAVGVGVVVGLLVVAFEEVVELMLELLFDRPLWQQALAPSLGLIAAWLLLRFLGGKDATPSTSDEYIRAFHERSPRMSLRHFPAKILAGISTIGCGGALGMEGPSVYAGASTAHHLQRILGRFFRREEAKMLLTAGAAAGVAAIFRTPATGVIFALEVPYRDDVTRRALLPSLVASAVSYLVFVAVLGADPVFPALGAESVGLRMVDLLGGALLGLTAGLGGRGYAALVRRAKGLSTEFSPLFRLLTSGVILAGLVLATNAVFGQPLSLGPGLRSADWLLGAERSLWLIAALFGFRMLATLATLGAGGTGGLFFPLGIQGLLMGSFVGQVLGQTETSLYPTLGLSAFLAAGYRAPIAAVMFVAESSRGSSFVVPALIAAAVAQLVAGRSGVSSYQATERLGHLEKRFILPITSVLRTDVLTAPPDASITEFMVSHVQGRREREVPVVAGQRYLGMCGLDQLQELSREDWDSKTVGEMTATNLPAARPSWTLRDAVAAMETADVSVLAVVTAEGMFVGLVAAEDILKLDEILDETDS